MFAKSRTGSLLPSLLILLLVLGLVAFVALERLQSNERDIRLSQLYQSARLARELSLYVQYNAHDTNAYTLGHLEHREEYVEHRDAFNGIVKDLQTHIAEGVLEEENEQPLLDIEQTRKEYDRASERLFGAADANRGDPSAENQEEEDAAWAAADELGDRLDTESQELASTIDADARETLTELEQRNRQTIAVILAAGAVIAALIALIHRRVTKAEEEQLDLRLSWSTLPTP